MSTSEKCGASGLALVVGGASGIGRATALELARTGWSVAVADLRAEPISEEDPTIDRVVMDVRSSTSVNDAVSRCVERFGRLDALVYAAGIVDPALATETTDEAWAQMFDVHVQGAHRVLRAAHPFLTKSAAPAVCLVSSIAQGAVARAALLGVVHRRTRRPFVSSLLQRSQERC